MKQPRPAAAPLTAAITGFGMSRSVVIIGFVTSRNATSTPAAPGVVGERVEDIRAGAERPSLPGDQDGPHRIVRAQLPQRLQEQPTALVVQRVEALGPAQLQSYGAALARQADLWVVGHGLPARHIRTMYLRICLISRTNGRYGRFGPDV